MTKEELTLVYKDLNRVYAMMMAMDEETLKRELSETNGDLWRVYDMCAAICEQVENLGR